MADPTADMFAGMKKKKKKVKAVPDPAAADSPSSIIIPDEFAGLKKKKKKKPTDEDPSISLAVSDEELVVSLEQEQSTNIQDSEFEDFAILFKNKKKKRIDLITFEALLKEDGFEPFFADDIHYHSSAMPAGDVDSSSGSAWQGSSRDLTYQELLTRVFQVLRQNNPELAGDKKKYTIVPPDVQREGSKKTAFSNLVDICKRMHRQPDHVIQFLFSELGTSGSIDGNQGRFQQKQIENVLKRYIVEYVTCKTCKSADTILTKENRLFFLQCESCGSTRTVSAIKAGFQAQIGRRAAQRT